MPKPQTRLIWVIVACLAWQYGVLAEGHGLARESITALIVEVLSYGLGLGALVVAVSERAQKWLEGWRLFAIFTFFFVTFGVVDFIARSKVPYTQTTDAHVYMDYAARLVLGGHNPYDTSLYGAIISTRTPIEFQTPLDNGGMSDRLAYPALSVLYLVPFVLLHIPTVFGYALAFYGCLAILFRVAPRELRPLVLIPFLADENYFTFAFGGITDTGWALFLCLVVVAWKRPKLAALFFGLACSYKQHPWLLAPFLAIRIATEVPLGQRLRAVVRFFGITAAVFFAVNLPFLLWSPKSWILGVVEPLVTSMVPLGEGPSSLLVYAGWSIPKGVFSLGFWGLYLVLLAVCASWRGGNVFLWIAPSIAFFFNYRSLNSYWYFNILPLVVELALRARDGDDVLESALPPLLAIRWRPLRPLLAGAVVVLCAVGGWASHRRNDAVDLVVDCPIRTFFGFAYRMDVKLTNRGPRPITPRFWVQGITAQPLPWHSDGPNELAPGQTGQYSLDAPNRISQFELPRGARLTVTDLDSSLRKSVLIERDEAALTPHAVPNARFRYWDITTGTPTYWLPMRTGSPGAHVLPMLAGEHQGVQFILDGDIEKVRRDLLDYCQAVPSCYLWTGAVPRAAAEPDAKDHRLEMAADFAGHPGKLSFWVLPPKDANVPPALADRYGVDIAFDNRKVTLLFGGEAGSGTFDDGTPYEIMPAAREVWSLQTIDLGALQKQYAPDVYPKAGALWRFPLIEIPMVIVKVQLFFASRSPETKSAFFGPIIDDEHGKDSIADEMALLDEHPGAVDAWRSHYEWNLKNPTRAKQYLARARRNEHNATLELDAAFQALATQQLKEAEQIFTGLLSSMPVEAHVGLANCAMVEEQPAMAKPHFELALAELAKINEQRELTSDEGLKQLGARLGLSDAQTLLGECDGAQKTLDLVPKGERDAHVLAMAKEKSFAKSPCK